MGTDDAGERTCADDGTALAIGHAWMAAAARSDLAAIADAMAEHCMRYGEPDWVRTDKASYVAGYANFTAAFSDYRLEIVNAVGHGRTAVFEMIEGATFSGPYVLPNGRVIRPNGRSYTDRVCTWLEVNGDGLIIEIRAYIPSNRGRLLGDALANTA